MYCLEDYNNEDDVRFLLMKLQIISDMRKHLIVLYPAVEQQEHYLTANELLIQNELAIEVEIKKHKK